MGSMPSRFRKIIDSVVYAGMKADTRTQPGSLASEKGLFGPLRCFFCGPAPSDPLYLTNRTVGQKAKSILLFTMAAIIVTGLAICGMRYYAASYFSAQRKLTKKAITALSLPHLGEAFR